MKAITLWQPWASLAALGIKTIETRSWPTAHRGRLLLHAAARQPDPAPLGPWKPYYAYSPACWALAHYASGVEGAPPDLPLPLGAIVGSCEITACVPILGDPLPEGTSGRFIRIRSDGKLEDFDPALPLSVGWRIISEQIPYGDWTPGRFAWILNDIKPTEERCPACWGRAMIAEGQFCGWCDGAGISDPIEAKGHQQIWNWTP